VYVYFDMSVYLNVGLAYSAEQERRICMANLIKSRTISHCISYSIELILILIAPGKMTQTDWSKCW
jgi:hypothetical protein